jgi:hypothetical protein
MLLKQNNDVAGYVFFIIDKVILTVRVIVPELIIASCKLGMRLLFGVVLTKVNQK